MKLNWNIFKKKDLPDYYFQLPLPNGSAEFFGDIKQLSEQYWSEFDINPDIFGFQIQNGTEWKDGLSEK